MTSTDAQSSQNHPATIVAYRHFKNTGVVKQEWTYDSCDDTYGPVYTTYPVSPHEVIQPFKYQNELHLTPEGALENALRIQEDNVRSARAKLDRELLQLDLLKNQVGRIKVTEYKV